MNLTAGKLLQGDLARHLREVGWLTFTEIEVPGTNCEPGSWHGRVDVVAVRPRSYARKDLRAYEVKVNRSDFLNDVGTEKWRRYHAVFHRVFFAVPAGLIKKTEVPAEAGLIVRGDKGWAVVKTAMGHQPPNLSVDSVLALLFRGYEQDREIRNLRERLFYRDGVIESAAAFGHGIRQKLSQKEREIEPALRNLRAAVENLAGTSLEETWGVEELTRRLSVVFETLTSFDEDRKALETIAGYLRYLGGRYTSERGKTREQVLDLDLGSK